VHALPGQDRAENALVIALAKLSAWAGTGSDQRASRAERTWRRTRSASLSADEEEIDDSPERASGSSAADTGVCLVRDARAPWPWLLREGAAGPLHHRFRWHRLRGQRARRLVSSRAAADPAQRAGPSRTSSMKWQYGAMHARRPGLRNQYAGPAVAAAPGAALQRTGGRGKHARRRPCHVARCCLPPLPPQTQRRSSTAAWPPSPPSPPASRPRNTGSLRALVLVPWLYQRRIRLQRPLFPGEQLSPRSSLARAPPPPPMASRRPRRFLPPLGVPLPPGGRELLLRLRLRLRLLPQLRLPLCDPIAITARHPHPLGGAGCQWAL